MTTPASSAKPPWARHTWADANAIYVEVPDAGGGVPYVLKFTLSEGGLGKALLLLRTSYERADRTNYSAPGDDARIKRAGRSFGFTEAQRSSARDVLKKHGMIGKK